MNQEMYNLIALAQEGSAEAFGKLYAVYAEEMYRYACCMVKNSDLAQDAVQDAVMTAFKEIRSLRNAEAFKNWLFRILNVACRKQYIASVQYLPIIDEYNYDEEACESCGGGIGNAELSMELRRALAILSPDERKIVILRTVFEYGSREIAEIMGKPDSTIRTKLRRSLEKLRKYMASEEYACA